MSDGDVPVLDGQLLRHDWSLPDPQSTEDKDERGVIAVIGGAVSTPGAAMLAGLAALRVGAGKLMLATAEPNAAAMAVAIPEAGVTGVATTRAGGLGADAASAAGDVVAAADAVLVGPGLTGPEDTRALVSGLLPHLADDAILVLDAIAATCGALDDLRDHKLGDDRVIVTPNAKEASYLLDDETAADAATARRIAAKYDVTVVLGSVVSLPDGSSWQSLRGNSGLGTSGSGDVLAGAVTGIAARGVGSTHAALWGLHLHSTGGDRLARRVGPVGYLARELLDELPRSLHLPEES